MHFNSYHIVIYLFCSFQFILDFFFFVWDLYCNFLVSDVKGLKGNTNTFFLCMNLFQLPSSKFLEIILDKCHSSTITYSLTVNSAVFMNPDIWFPPRMQPQRCLKMFLTFCVWLVSLLNDHFASCFLVENMWFMLAFLLIVPDSICEWLVWYWRGFSIAG